MAGSLRRYDVQARWAFALALVSLVPFLAAFRLAYRNYNGDLVQIVYRSGWYVVAFAASVLLSMLPSALALLMGVSSAGQRRNDRPAQAWLGFFVGGAVLTLNLILLIAFYKLRLEMPA